MAHYRLSGAAGRAFAQIFDYGIDEYGLKRATDYQNKLKQRFSELAETPLLYPAIDHIRAGYRRSVCGVHSIYYRIEGYCQHFSVNSIKGTLLKGFPGLLLRRQ